MGLNLCRGHWGLCGCEGIALYSGGHWGGADGGLWGQHESLGQAGQPTHVPQVFHLAVFHEYERSVLKPYHDKSESLLLRVGSAVIHISDIHRLPE